MIIPQLIDKFNESTCLLIGICVNVSAYFKTFCFNPLPSLPNTTAVLDQLSLLALTAFGFKAVATTLIPF